MASEIHVDVGSVVSLDESAASGVPAGAALSRFARAVLGADDGELGEARGALVAEVGPEGAGDAACVVAGFDSVNRIADATGVEVPELWLEAAPAVAPGVDFERFRYAE